MSDESSTTRDDAAEFEDVIDETENDYTGYDNALTTLASLGQTMPSQHNESSSLEDCDDGIFVDRDTKAGSYAVASSASTSVPCPRWGHTMTMIDHRRFVVYGGQTIDRGDEMPRTLADLYLHDLEDGSWTRPINCDGVARTWHTANFLPERRLLLCFGGEVLDEATGKLTTTDQVMVLDTESKFCVYVYRLYLFLFPSCVLSSFVEIEIISSFDRLGQSCYGIRPRFRAKSQAVEAVTPVASSPIRTNWSYSVA